MDFFAEEMMDLKPAAVPGRKQITMRQKIAKIQHFYRDRKEREEIVRRQEETERKKEIMAQLVFHFTRNRIRIVEEQEADFAFCFAERRKSQLEILMYHEEQELQDYLKYMAVPSQIREEEDPIERKERLAQSVVNELRAHPDYLSILFSRKILTEFLDSVKAWTTEEVKLSNEAAIKLCSWGLLDMEIRKKRGQTRAYFANAWDVECFEAYYRGLDLTQLYRRKEQTMQLITGLVQCYGILDLDTLYEKYTLLCEDPLGKEMWKRYIYLSGTFNSLFLTGEDSQSENQYVIMNGISIEKALERMGEVDCQEAYGSFAKKQVQGWKRGVAGYSSRFKALEEIMESSGALVGKEEILQEKMEQLYCLVMQGEELEELCRFWRDSWREELPKEDPQIREIINDIYQHTAIIPLLAHSRSEFMDRT